MLTSLIIAGVEISTMAMLDYEQTWEPVVGASPLRMADGSLVKQALWRKWRTVLSGSGWVPAPLLAIDYDSPFVLQSTHPLALRAGESLPAGWSLRTGDWVEKTVVDQTGVSVRLVYPVLTVFGELTHLRVGNDATPSWSLTCEQA